jgi:hypothetical protein
MSDGGIAPWQPLILSAVHLAWLPHWPAKPAKPLIKTIVIVLHVDALNVQRSALNSILNSSIRRAEL